MSEEYSIGIDLGTTYSCLAYVDETGNPVVEKNYEQEETTPSVILFNDVGEKIVGSSAKELFTMYPPERTIFDIKRQIGTEYLLDIDGNEYTPSSLSAIILLKLLRDFEDAHGLEEGSVKKAVITVPAYFKQNEREATVNAGLIAGLEEVTLLNEPTAAAVCFGYGNNGDGPKKVLVYDLGGGTFDVSILQVDGKSFTGIATDGERYLGGKDWDEEMKKLIIGKISEMSGLEEDELNADPDVKEKLITDSEELKKRLSTSESTRGTMSIGGKKVLYTVTREEFEAATKHLVNSTVELVDTVLKDAKLTIDDIDAFLLVGGSSRMPQVESAILAKFPSAKIKLYDPDQSVAKGAAVYCRSKDVLKEIARKIEEDSVRQNTVSDAKAVSEKVDEAAKTMADAIVVHNVLSKSFGVKSSDNSGNVYISNIIFKNEKLPLIHDKTYYPAVDGQILIDVEIYENNAQNNDDGLRVDVVDSAPAGSFNMKLPEDVTADTEIKIRFTVSDEGLLTAYAECKEMHEEYVLKTKTSMSEEEILRHRNIVERNNC